MSQSDSLAPPKDYLKTYSLTCEPFANTIDGRFFYAGPALMQRLDLLTHLTQFGESVILVSGPPGSGKTTLLGRFVAHGGRQWRLCLLNADEFAQFGRRLGDAVGIGDSSDEIRLLQQWAGSHDASQLLVIVVDDAQRLQPDALDRLCQLLEQPEGDRVRVILFGTPQSQAAVRQSLENRSPSLSAQLLDIPRLSEEETAAYLMYRLAVAGYSGESPFTATEVRAICKAAEGCPAAINQLAHEALVEHQMRRRSKRLQVRRPGWMSRPSTWGAASIGVIAVAAWFALDRMQPETPAEMQNRITTTSQEVPLAIPAQTADEPGAAKPTAEPAPVPTVEEVVAAGAPEPEIDPAGDTSSPTTGTPAMEDAPAATSKQELQSSDPASSMPVEPEPVRTIAVKTEPATGAAPVAGSGTPVPAPPAPEPSAPAESVTPQPKAEQPAPKPAAASASPHREPWLLQQPASHYSLQVLGSRQEASILDYIRESGLDRENCAYYRSRFKGADWFVLMYGNYPTRDAALAARSTLPTRVQKEKPWPRSLASVHTAIRETP